MICREYPPAPAGGIGTYTVHMARLLADAGETVHVISQLRRGGQALETDVGGRLIIHRIPLPNAPALLRRRADTTAPLERALADPYPPRHFSWQVSRLAERLVEEAQVDVLEAPEYEAALYDFQIRRVLGYGPRRTPPVLIHFHSPTELIVRFDDWDPGVPANVMAQRLEDASVAAADAWVCPSQFLARQAEAMYGLAAGSVAVVPYPLGAQPPLERDRDTWARGTICYVGRLEARKGVIEWIQAAAAVAVDHPDARFEFVGRNILESRWLAGDEVVARLIPERVRHQFAFLGEQPRAVLGRHLARARIAVVPSRWDNFPNACVEAMASGLPVLASREGGMVEMIGEGRTGWLAPPDPADLAGALRRALATPPDTLAAMGRQAAADIRALCDNDRIVASRLKLHRTLSETRATRSTSVPASLPWLRSGSAAVPRRRAAPSDTAEGIAVIVTGSAPRRAIDECVEALARQSRRPDAVIVDGERASAIETLRRRGARPLGVVFLEAGDRLDAEFVAVTERVLAHCPSVGVVSCWTRSRDARTRVRVRPCPAFPYQWLWNDAAPCSAVRFAALNDVGPLAPVASRADADWFLATAVMAAGWAAATVPAILASHAPEEAGSLRPAVAAMRRTLLQRFAGVAAHDAQDLVLLTSSPGAVWLGHDELSARDYARMAWEARGRYGHVVRWIFAKSKLELAQRWSAWRRNRRTGDGARR